MLDLTTPVGDLDCRAYSTRDVIEKLVMPHHRYLRQAMPFLQKVATKVARIHGDTETSLVEIAQQFDVLVATLDAHMDEEEAELFPALIEDRERDAVPMLLDMRREHEQVGEMLRELRRVARDYRPPGWACNSYRTLLYELRALEQDVFEHLHIENHVLLPRFVP